MDAARRETERILRQSYSRLLAYLAKRTRDVAACEDALGGALVAALDRWPIDGVPHNPEAWLLTTARRKLIDAARQSEVRYDADPVLRQLAEAQSRMSREHDIPDERLELLFVCAHPALDAGVRTPLMLQAVLGIDAATIGSAFLVSPTAMSQRLVRAKTKIRDAGLRFERPLADEWPQRVDAVLTCVYAAYGLGWESVDGGEHWRRELADEALWLARLITRLLPGNAEALGLLSLLLYCESRRQARRDAAGKYIPLSEQDATQWSLPLIDEAEQCLQAAARQQSFGRFQLEAAIQSAHSRRAIDGQVDWNAIVALYDALLQQSPTLGARIARAAALAEAAGSKAALDALDAIPATEARHYQPYWAVKSHLLLSLERPAEGCEALEMAIGLSENDAVRQWLQAKLKTCRIAE